MSRSASICSSSSRRWHSSLPLSRLLILILLFIAAIHPHPGPSSSSRLIVAQWNCNGIKNSAAELRNFLEINSVKVCVLQETKLRENDPRTPKFPGYNLVVKNRHGQGGGGVAVLVHSSVDFLPLDASAFERNDQHAEILAVTINPSTLPVDIVCVYIPPASSRALPRGYAPNMDALLSITNNDALVLGDFNAHSGAWHSSLSDRRGEAIAAAIVHTSFAFLNHDSPTRLARDETASSPDISIASASLAGICRLVCPY